MRARLPLREPVVPYTLLASAKPAELVMKNSKMEIQNYKLMKDPPIT
jgi:hypothetical protein